MVFVLLGLFYNEHLHITKESKLITMTTENPNAILNILLADDDKDDRFFFAKALEGLTVETKLRTVRNGQELIEYLARNFEKLPDVLFLDLNMPRKNGSECLTEIKSNKKIKEFPVIIYSTSLNDEIADILYQKGAHYYMRKCDLSELQIQLQQMLSMLEKNNFKRPSRNRFILNEPCQELIYTY